MVAYLGDVAESSPLGGKQAATKQAGSWQSRLFDDEPQPEWVEVDANRVKVEGVRDFGGCWKPIVAPPVCSRSMSENGRAVAQRWYGG